MSKSEKTWIELMELSSLANRRLTAPSHFFSVIMLLNPSLYYEVGYVTKSKILEAQQDLNFHPVHKVH